MSRSLSAANGVTLNSAKNPKVPPALLSHEKIFVVLQYVVFIQDVRSCCGQLGLSDRSRVASAVQESSGQSLLGLFFFRTESKHPLVNSAKPKASVFVSSFVPQFIEKNNKITAIS